MASKRFHLLLFRYSFYALSFGVKLHALSLNDVHHARSFQSAQPEGNLYVAIIVSTFCILFAGLMSGLTVGLASIDRLALEVDSMDNRQVKEMTERIFPVID